MTKIMTDWKILNPLHLNNIHDMIKALENTFYAIYNLTAHIQPFGL